MRLRERARFGLEPNAALLFWAMFFIQAAFGASDRFKGLYIESLGAKPALVGLVLGGAEFVRLLFLIASGPLSDRVSPRILLNMRWLAVANALVYLLALQWWHLFPAFAFQAAANLAWPTVSRTIDEAGDDAGRSRRFLLVYSIAPNAPLLFAPLIGGVVAQAFGLRAVFAILTCGLIVSGCFFSSVRPPQHTRRVTSGGYGAVLRHRPTALICGLQGFAMFVAWLGLTLAPNYLHSVQGLSFRVIGAFGTLVAVGSIGTGLLIARVPRLGHSMNGSLVTFAALPAVFALLLLGRTTLVFGAAYLCWGIASVAQQTFYGAVAEATPARMRTRGFALLEVTYSAGVMLAGFAAGALYAFGPRLPLAAALMGSVIVVGATVLVRRVVIGWHAANAANDANDASVANAATVA